MTGSGTLSPDVLAERLMLAIYAYGTNTGANPVICYGRGGDISTNRREEVEMTALCLRILQAALVYVNTLMLQAALADEDWSGLLGGRPPGSDPAVLAARAALWGVRLDMRSQLRIRSSG